ncbi:MAG: zinc ribbon domain-containing protein, partial [Burkholderiales bacterium]
MFCHNCGSSQADNATFCAQCGARQTPEDAAANASASATPISSPSLSGREGNEAVTSSSDVTRPTRADERARGSRVGTAVLWLVTL